MVVYILMTIASCTIAFFAQRYINKDDALASDCITVWRYKLPKAGIFLSFAAIPLILVSGLRWDMGVDYLNYYYVFTNVNFGLDTHVEIGFKLLCRFIWLFSKDMAWLFMICTLVTVIMTFIAIKQNSTNLFISVFLFITMGYFYYSMNSIRHFMALAIYLFAFRFIKRRKPIHYILLILLAATFHKIALVALPLYFLLNIKYKAYWYGIFAGALLLLNLFNRQILDFVYQYVFDFYKAVEGEHVGISVVNIGIMLALTVLCVLYRKKLLERSSRNIILINAAFLGLIFFAFCGWIPEYTRIGQYLVMLSLFLVPEILECVDNPKIKKFYTLAIIVGFSAFMIVMLIKASDKTVQLLPYRSIFTRDGYWL